MKKEKIVKLLKPAAVPLLATLIGLILLVYPDAATIIVSQLCGWILVIYSAAKAISMATKRTSSSGGWIWAALGIVLGVVILSKPLLPVATISRFLGILLVVRSVGELQKATYRRAKILAIVTFAVGAVLVLVPMALTRTLLRLCGLVVSVVGIVNVLEKLQETKRLKSGDRPDIIDADE